jgi:RNA polymerase sigma-32 factor
MDLDGDESNLPADATRYNVPAPYAPASPPAEPSADDSLEAYLAEIRRFKLLTRVEEDNLLKFYAETGDPATSHKIITSNLRLVVKIALEFQSSWLHNLQDLIQEGNLGLLQALKKFDPSRGVKFSYYAAYWIKAYIMKFIMDNWRLVKVGTTQHQRMLFYRLRRERERILKEGLEPAPRLLAQRLGVTQEEVEEMNARLGSGVEFSLDAPAREGSDETQGHFIPSAEPRADNILADAQVRELVADRLARFRKTLNERETRILEKRLMSEDPVTLQELGEEFGISRERVRQIEERLKEKLATYFKKELPELSA